MVRPVRMSIIAISVVLVLFTVPMGVSAKKKISKRKNRKARTVAVMVVPRVMRSVPVVVTAPVLTPAVVDGNSFMRAEASPATNQARSAASAAPTAGGGPVSQGSGDSDGKGRKPWAVRPLTPAAGSLIISEFRLQGPAGFGDEFVEIYNDSGADHTVSASSGTGYAVAASDGIARCLIPNGTVIPARGHYLCTNSGAGGYSLGSYPAGNGNVATGDATYTTQITNGEDPDGMGGNPPTARQGIALFNNNSGGGSFSLVNRFDAVGPVDEANTLYKEGSGVPNLTPFNIDYAYVRDECGKSGSIPTLGVCSISTPKDTDDNALDFFFVDTNGTSAGAGQRLGAPGPQNLSSSIQRNSTITENSLDATVASPPPSLRSQASLAPSPGSQTAP